MPHLPSTNDSLGSLQFNAPLKIQEGQNNCGSKTHQEPFYYVLENPTPSNERALQIDGSNNLGQIDKYLLEELSTEGLEKPLNHGAEPLYYVLDDPNFEETKDPSHHGVISFEEPIYNSLEDLSLDDHSEVNCNYKCTNEPVYKVLEEVSYPSISAADKESSSDLQGHVYYVLEGPK